MSHKVPLDGEGLMKRRLTAKSATCRRTVGARSASALGERANLPRLVEAATHGVSPWEPWCSTSLGCLGGGSDGLQCGQHFQPKRAPVQQTLF